MYKSFKMNISIEKSKNMNNWMEKFSFTLGTKHYNLGVIWYDWGVRFMFIWWHVCIHFK